MAATESVPARASHAELLAMMEAPDLSKAERRELRRMARHQKRIETWEARRATPHPPKYHRAVITLLMMGACLWLLWLLLSGPPS